MDKRSIRTRGRGVFLAMIVLMVAQAAVSTEATAPRIVRIVPSPTEISWLPLLPERTLVLTVSGKQIYLRQAFLPGVNPSLALVGPDGGALPDGSYGWEIHPSGPAKGTGPPEAVEEVREKKGVEDPEMPKTRFERRPLRRLLPESGDFWIENGVFIVPSTTTEPTSDRHQPQGE